MSLPFSQNVENPGGSAGPKFYAKGGDNMVNDFDEKDSKYTNKSIYTLIISSNFEARTTFLFFNMPF